MRLKGKSYKREVIILAEKVFYHPVVIAHHKMKKLPSEWKKASSLTCESPATHFMLAPTKVFLRPDQSKEYLGQIGVTMTC